MTPCAGVAFNAFHLARAVHGWNREISPVDDICVLELVDELDKQSLLDDIGAELA
jgi:hypothetical protein